MSVNEVKGNMYPWADKTHNCFGDGICPHMCEYCYMWDLWKIWGWRGFSKLIPSRFQDKFRKQPMTIFEGSACDGWAEAIPSSDIQKVLAYNRQYPQHTWVYQSKNPDRFKYFLDSAPPKVLWGTTIESNRDYGRTKAPSPRQRFACICGTQSPLVSVFVSVEPIKDFDLKTFIRWMELIQPKFVSIGADSKGHNLPEPPGEKVRELIKALREFTDVRIKENLKRILIK